MDRVGEWRLLTGLWKEGRINEGEGREWWGRWRRDEEEREMENGSFTGGTVDRRVDKGMGEKREGSGERGGLDGREGRVTGGG